MNNPTPAVATAQSAFDEFGVPQTAAAAKSMSKDAIRTAVTNVIAYLEETAPTEVACWPAGEDGSVSVDSQLGVDVYNEFVGHLARTRFELTDIDQDKWSSVDGLTDVLAEAFANVEDET